MTAGGERVTVVGLARVRSPWFVALAQWADSGEIDATFRKCVSAAQVRELLASASGRWVLIADVDAAGVDRSLVTGASERGVPTILVGRTDGGGTGDLGAAGRLPSDFDRAALRDALRAAVRDASVTRPHPVADRGPARMQADPPPPERFRGRLIAVTGGTGCGRSTIAMALAQGLAAVPGNEGGVVLADFAERGDLAVYHHTGDVVPGLSELVEEHRAGIPTGAQLRSHLFDIEHRGYHLLQGRRRTRDWIDLGRRPLAAAMASLRSSFRMVVVDTDNDVDGLDETGSDDAERRNAPARLALGTCDLAIVCGDASLKGLHSLVRAERELADWRDGPRFVVRVVNRAQRAPRSRAELTATLAELTTPRAGEARPITVAGPIFLPHRAAIEGAHRLVEPLPAAIVEPVTRAVLGLLDRAAPGFRGDHGQ